MNQFAAGWFAILPWGGLFMNIKKATTVLALAAVFAVTPAWAQGFFFKLFHPDEVGAGFTVTHHSRLGPVTAGGPGIELMASYRLSNHFFINAGTGLYTITDKLLASSTTSATMLPILDMKIGYRLLPGKKFSPYILTGITAFGLKSSQTVPGAVPDVQGPFFDGGVSIGLGFEYRLNHQWTFFASGDYRYIFTASNNQLLGNNTVPQHYVAKGGVRFSLNPVLMAAREEIEYPLGESELVLDDLFREEPSRPESRAGMEEEDALAMLFRPDTEQTAYESGEALAANVRPEKVEYPDSEIGTLMRKVDEMKDMIRERNETVQDLKDQVRANEKAIAEMSRGAVNIPSGSFGITDPQGFKQHYESALQLFFGKNYQEAISRFENLMRSNPDHRLASNCQYWIGESYYAMRDYRRAINAFQEVMNYRRSYKFDDALIMSGLSYMRLGDSIMAREHFQQLISRFPESEYTPKAMRYLGQL